MPRLLQVHNNLLHQTTIHLLHLALLASQHILMDNLKLLITEEILPSRRSGMVKSKVGSHTLLPKSAMARSKLLRTAILSLKLVMVKFRVERADGLNMVDVLDVVGHLILHMAENAGTVDHGDQVTTAANNGVDGHKAAKANHGVMVEIMAHRSTPSLKSETVRFKHHQHLPMDILSLKSKMAKFKQDQRRSPTTLATAGIHTDGSAALLQHQLLFGSHILLLLALILIMAAHLSVKFPMAKFRLYITLSNHHRI
jgi:hypothetical protein